MAYKEYQSADIARAALRMSLTETRADENALKGRLAKDGIRAVAVNFGGKFLDILPKIFESAIVAAQRQKVISDTHVGDGSVVGAMESAIEQVKPMAIGMNVGGKIGIAAGMSISASRSSSAWVCFISMRSRWAWRIVSFGMICLIEKIIRGRE